MDKFLTSSDGLKIYYNLLQKTGPMLIFLHGLGVNHTIWKDEMEYLHRHGRSVMSLDLRGHGKSDKPSTREKYSMERFSKDVSEVMETEKIDTTVLVGHSMGGMIALKFYEMFPNLVKGLVLVDTTYKISKDTVNPLVRPGLMLGTIIDHFTTHRQKYIDFSKLKRYSDLHLLYEIDASGNPAVGQNCIEELKSFDEENLLEKIKVPTLVIGSKYDGFFRLSVPQEMARRIPLSDLQILSGTHTIVLKKPRLISKSIAVFLQRNEI